MRVIWARSCTCDRKAMISPNPNKLSKHGICFSLSMRSSELNLAQSRDSNAMVSLIPHPPPPCQVSKACTSICQWVRAMHTYYFVAKAVAPKREALRKAQAELEETQKVLWEAMSTLKEVEAGVAKLQANYTRCVRKKKDLENKCRQCEARLIRADKVRIQDGEICVCVCVCVCIWWWCVWGCGGVYVGVGVFV